MEQPDQNCPKQAYTNDRPVQTCFRPVQTRFRPVQCCQFDRLVQVGVLTGPFQDFFTDLYKHVKFCLCIPCQYCTNLSRPMFSFRSDLRNLSHFPRFPKLNESDFAISTHISMTSCDVIWKNLRQLHIWLQWLCIRALDSDLSYFKFYEAEHRPGPSLNVGCVVLAQMLTKLRLA